MEQHPFRVVVLTNIPAPYRFPLFRALNKFPDLKLKVFYTAPTYSNRRWQPPKDAGFDYQILPGITIPMRRTVTQDDFYLDVNPTAFWELQRAHPDVVIISGYASLACLQAYYQFKLQRKSIVMWGEGNYRAKPGRFHKLLLPLIRRLHRGADACIASSTCACKLYLQYGVPQERIFLSPLVADFSFFYHLSRINPMEKSRLRSNLGLTDKPVVLYVGRLVETKGIVTLIEALEYLKNRGVHADLLVIGDGALRVYLEQRCRRGGINAFFTGYIEHGIARPNPSMAGILSSHWLCDSVAFIRPDC